MARSGRTKVGLSGSPARFGGNQGPPETSRCYRAPRAPAVLRRSLEKFDLAWAASLMILNRRLLLVRRCAAAEEIV